jgi:hypothetical protein
MNAFSQPVDNKKVTKGYYSIGNNESILTDVDTKNLISDTFVPDPYSQAPKGYYSPEVNRRKIPWRKVRDVKKAVIPVVTKGYYSIGQNALQLKK